MKRAYKYGLLLATGGLMLQVGGCASGLAGVLIQNFVGLFFSAILSALLGGDTGTTA